MKKRKLTQTQTNLLEKLKIYISTNKYSSLDYDKLKQLTGFNSFDSSFNAILYKGYLNRLEGTNKYYLAQ